jgi:hypothetical protein
MTSLLLLAAVSIGFAWGFAWMQVKDHARYVARLHDEHSRERELWHRERQMLLNRIKPETAQFVPSTEPVQAPPALGFDDEQSYWESQGLSTDDLATAMFEQELAGRPE